MMKRYLMSLLVAFLGFLNTSSSQMDIIFSTETAAVGGTVDVDVTVNGFTNISVLQFSAAWDSTVMKFGSVVFTNPSLSDNLSPDNISGPSGVTVDEGQFTFSFGDPTGNSTLPNGSILFTVRFNIVGAMCATTTVVMTDDPTDIEAFDNNFNEITVIPQSGMVSIDGVDCGGGGDDNLTITASTLNVGQGQNICVPLKVKNFIDVQAGSGTILWNPAILDYTGINNINIAGVQGSLNESMVDAGELKFVWSNPSPSTPLTLMDGESIFDICFDAIGAVGSMSVITLSDQGSLGFEWFDDDDNTIPQTLVNGKVTIVSNMGDPLTVNVADTNVDDSATNVCVDFSVENWDDVISSQYVITWDPALLTNATPTSFNLEGLNASLFNIGNGSAVLSWSTTEAQDLADGTVIYQMCFDILGDCGASSDIDIVSMGSTNIEFVDSNTNTIDNYLINPGSVTVTCSDCEILSIDRPCPGALDGNVTVNVDDGCSYSWANSAGVEVATTKNLLGVGAGTYILTVSCGGQEVCSLQAVVVALPDMTVSGNVTNAACGILGTISVSVDGGSNNYSYNWNPAQPNSPNLTGLNPGVYALTVTDTGSGCTKTASFEVTNQVLPLVISSSNVVDENCLGNNGRISIVVMGGCTPYTYAWSDSTIGNTPNAENLAAGTYTVTVSDASVPSMMVTGSFVVDPADMIVLSGSPVITGSSGSDGSITINVIGGTMPYNFTWTGPTTGLPNSNAVNGLMAGIYSVVVTDASGCSASFGPFEVGVIGSMFMVTDPVVVGGNDEFDILCNGDNTASITASISGTGPFTINLSGTESRTLTQASAGVLSLNALRAGTYALTVTGPDGSSQVFNNITISEPPLFELEIDKGCDNGSCDGFIDLSFTGGVGDVDVAWVDPNLSGVSNDDLCQGSYVMTATDDHGCVIMESIVVEPCSLVPEDCYEVRDVITPNGDGVNDRFRVTCVTDFPTNLEVYDRWGKLVYSQENYDGRWEGLATNGDELIEGGYMYVMTIDFGQGRREIMKGTLTLLR